VHPIWADVIGQTLNGLQRHESSVGIAVPSLALETMWRISRRFAFTARAQYLGGAVHGYRGTFADYHGDFQYRWRKNFALGLGYSYQRVSYESLTHDPFGRLALALDGPEAFVRVAF
jgi:hypothetical protein